MVFTFLVVMLSVGSTALANRYREFVVIAAEDAKRLKVDVGFYLPGALRLRAQPVATTAQDLEVYLKTFGISSFGLRVTEASTSETPDSFWEAAYLCKKGYRIFLGRKTKSGWEFGRVNCR